MSFAAEYADSGISRFHMPGHKGVKLHGLEPYDLTEIRGADELFEPEGIIARGEQLTARAYGSRRSFWSAEGSSLSIKTSVCIIRQLLGRPVRIAAARNCHRAFISACALFDIDPLWLAPSESSELCACPVTAQQVSELLDREPVDAVYITSPDYYGNLADIAGIADVCRSRGVLLICDNAHGAYLRFAGKGLHPLDLGADIVCDSAHKTLPAYTGGAYLHIAKSAPEGLDELVKPAMALLGSTSPSYLIMGSLDICADLLNGELPEMIRARCERIAEIKALMNKRSIPDLSEEPMKITLAAEWIGYDGRELADIMRGYKMECEYSDPAAVVLMISPYNSEEDLLRLEKFLTELELHAPLNRSIPKIKGVLPERVMSIREAMLSPAVRVPVENSDGRVSARGAMSCQPSVAAVMPGERINAEIIKILQRYGISHTDVI